MQVKKVSPVSFGMIKPIRKEGNLPKKDNISFGYSDKLKTLFKKGKFPSVIVDAFGEKLTPDNVTLDHVIPKCEGGLSRTENYMLATDYFNQLRGRKPLRLFVTDEGLNKYLNQFVNICVDGFDGNKYIRDLMKTLERAKRLGV